MPGLYSDFFEAAAYQNANGGLGLPYLSPGDIAIATDWNLNPASTTTLPNVSGTVTAAQLPGFILAQSYNIGTVVSNSTLASGAVDGNGTFTGITEINAGTVSNPILIGTPNIGFVMQVGSDKGGSITLSNTNNTYTGGTTILAGHLVIAADGSLGAAPTDNGVLTFDAEGLPDNVVAFVQADNGIIFNSLSEGNGTLTLGAANAIADSSGVILGRVGGAGGTIPTANGGATAILALGADNQLNSLSDDAGNTTLVQLNGHQLTLTPAPGIDSDFGGVISDGSTSGGSLVIDGAGMVTLNGDDTYTGGTTIADGSTLEIGATGVAGSGTISFAGTGDTLKIDSATMPSNTLVGMTAGEKIDLAGIAVNGAGSVDLLAGNKLQITEDGNIYDLQLDPSSNFTGDVFQLASDDSGLFGGSGGTVLTESHAPCYCRGTLIATDHGKVPVEALRIGDLIVTANGEALPLKWIGRRSYRDWLAVGNADVQPILFKTGSIADHVPARDLYVSPEHAMFLDGVLVPARHLVNGVSILKIEGMEEVDYFHLEFDRHVVIFAEGARAESFVDDESRMLFHNADEYRRLYPDEQRPDRAEFCAPRAESGQRLYTLGRTLAARAAHLQPDGIAAPLCWRGQVDLVANTLIAGWAFSGADAGPVPLAILVNGAVIGQIVADRYRADLEAAGIGDGRHAFTFMLPKGLNPDADHRIEVRREADWSLLHGAARERLRH
jgi:O-antigen biosynthesis protein